MNRLRPLLAFAAVLTTLLVVGCSPSIGDDCEFSSDCSVNSDRICDTAQPGGYCTVRDCERDTCPEDSVCVRWRGELSRIAQTWCMATCEENSDCREEYECVRSSELLDRTRPIETEVLDGEDERFCVARPVDDS